MTSGKVRLKDVAAHAGVAVTTASTILNRRPNSWASKETEARVFAAAEELGYRPNRAAVALQSGQSKTLGLLVADLENPFYTHFSKVFGNQIEEKGYDLVIESWQTDLAREKKVLEELIHRNFDGALLFLSDVESHWELLEKQQSKGFPIVAIAMPGAETTAVDVLMPDFSPGIREAAHCLHGMGHRRFAFLAARSPGQRVGRRPAYFEEVIADLGGSHCEIVECGPALSDAREVSRKILSRSDRPTAMMTLNDLSAVGAMRAATDLKIKVPDELSVVGIDGIPLAEQLVISLSTVAQPYEEMAAEAVSFLLNRIEGGQEMGPQRVTFPTRFIKRESIALCP